MNLQLARSLVNRKLASYQNACALCVSERTALAEADKQLEATRIALDLSQKVAKEVQAVVHAKVASIVSRALSAVFPEPYEFRLNFEDKGGRTQAVLTFERDGMEVDPMTASGGGVIDIAALALRISCLLLAQPPVRRLIVADEPLRHLSRNFRSKARDFFAVLSEELKIQMIFVTHDEGLVTGKVVEL